MRTAATIAAQGNGDNTETVTEAPKRKRGNPATLMAPWKPGQSGNPGGRKKDAASGIARAIFEQNEEVIYKSFGVALAKGNAYAFQVLADRAFGKMKESLEVSGLEGLADAIARGRKRAGSKQPSDATSE